VRIYRGVVDFFGQIKSILAAKFCEGAVAVYDETLKVCGINLANPIKDDCPSEILITNLNTNTSCSPDKTYRQFASKANTQGNLFTDINPVGFNSREISTIYKGLDNPYSILQFILDMMIFNINRTNFPILICGDERTSLDNYEIYLLGEVEKYRRYLRDLTCQGFDVFEGSEICNRVKNLIDVGIGERRAEFAWAAYVGYDLIEEISIRIGGELIDSHNYKWMYLDYKMNERRDQVRAHNMMVGNIGELREYSRCGKLAHKMYVPVQFWFCKNISQSLPMVALQHSEVAITVKIKQLREVAYWNEVDTYFVKIPELNCYLLADYIYLDSDERKRFADMAHEYIIETVQRTLCAGGNKLLDLVCGRTISAGVYVSNICKYLLWVVRFNKTFRLDVDGSDYSKHRVLKWNDFYNMGDNDAIRGFDIKFDQRDRETMKHHSYYNLVQPYEKYCSSLPKNVFLYSFALFPKNMEASGGVNVDMINDLSISMELSEEIVQLINEGLVEVEFDVYAKEINILRVSGGIAGVGFERRKN
ncbi:MAG: NCLDV major capsid protein, partial [Harvfovirus sp.]